MNINDTHIPYSLNEAKHLIEETETRLMKKSATFRRLSHACNFVAATIGGLLVLIHLNGHTSSYSALGIIAIGILLYKGFDWLWQSQLTGIYMTEYMQDNGMRPLTLFELAELKHFIEPNKYVSRMYAQWVKHDLIVRLRDKDYLYALMLSDAGITNPIDVQSWKLSSNEH